MEILNRTRMDCIMIRTARLLAIISISALFLISCTDETGRSESEETARSGMAEWEECIRALEKAYNDRDIDLYRVLILEPGSSEDFPGGFKYLFSYGDLQSPAEYTDYSKELESAAALFRHADSLHLSFSEAGWEKVDSLRGRSCRDCWKTSRSSRLVVLPGAGEVFSGEYISSIVVGPDPAEEGRYRVYQIADKLNAEKR
jgi:hypothetical protein